MSGRETQIAIALHDLRAAPASPPGVPVSWMEGHLRQELERFERWERTVLDRALSAQMLLGDLDTDCMSLESRANLARARELVESIGRGQ